MIDQARLVLEGLESTMVTRVRGREAMNELTRFEVVVLSFDDDVDTDALVDANAILGVADAGGEITEHHLVVVEAAHVGRFRGQERYRVVLTPGVGRLAQRVNHEIFQAMTTQQIVTKILERSGLGADDFGWRLAGPYVERVYTVMYGESEWAFITRLLADEGINYWFDRDGDATKLVFGDHPSSHDGLEASSAGAAGQIIPFDDGSGMGSSSFSFRALERTWSMVSTKASIRDVDLQNPTAPIDASSGEDGLEVFEYPSRILIPDAANARAKVRLEQLQRHRSTLRAVSSNARVRAGRIVEISGAADTVFDGRFLVTAVEHHLEANAQGEANATPYENHVTLVPFHEDVPFRPGLEPVRARPAIDGLETGVVTGPAGEEIHVDDLGRIKVRFMWDRSGVKDDKSSRWIRSLQMNLAAPQMLPRVGWEVPVVYEDGDPDRPFVLGRLYNGAAPTPYAMPGHGPTSTLQSATSPSDGTTQELRMGDSAGSQETFIHATKDQTVAVGGSHTVTVGANRTVDVKKTQTLHAGSQSETVGGNQTVTVGADAILAVKGGRTEAINGNEKIGVTGTYSVAVKGGYIEAVSALYSLRCNQSNATVQGAFTQVIGAALSTTAGLGSNQSVAGARVEVCGGSRSLTAAGAYADGTTGIKRIQAGVASESAGSDIAFKAGARGAVQAGGAIAIDAGAKVVFEAATLSVKAATLTAKGGSTMKLAGGLKSSSTIKYDAPLTKKKQTADFGG